MGVTTRFDPAKDVIIIPDCPIDCLDHATYKPNLGGKWPDVVEMDIDVRRRIDAIWDELKSYGIMKSLNIMLSTLPLKMPSIACSTNLRYGFSLGVTFEFQHQIRKYLLKLLSGFL